MSERPQTFFARLTSPIVHLREGEGTTALLMFAYSFMAMTSYNIIKPLTRGEFISSLGVLNLPWVQFANGILIGLIMQGFGKAVAAVPRRWTIPVTQAGMVGVLLLFWFLFTALNAPWVAIAFYVLGAIFGVLFISQFWTLANDVYDPRQAKRIFGFIGSGASLGSAMGAGLTAFLVERLGTENMLLMGAGTMALCLGIVVVLVRREQGAGTSDATNTGEEGGVSGAEALQLLRSSRHLQIISVVIAFGAIGAAIIDQQLNMAAAEFKGQGNADAISAFLGLVTVYLSLIGFVIQIGATSRIHRILGIGFALLILPVSFATTAGIILFNRALWAPSIARITDTALRYTVDKTSREVLFLPLPPELKFRAKPFVDVTMDRLAKGLSALMILVLVQEWGLGFSWQQLSYASLAITGLWVFVAIRARKEYLTTFRKSIDEQRVAPAQLLADAADPATVETLVGELAHPEPRRVLYAIDLLDSMDKRQLITPLLLWHDASTVRARALAIAEASGAALAERWLPGVERSLTDTDSQVRVAALHALAALRGQAAADVMRPFLGSSDPALAIAATVALASSHTENDVTLAEDVLKHFSSDTRDQNAGDRVQVARALGDIRNPRFRPLLVPLMFDADVEVARTAIESAGALGATDFLFVAPLVSLLRNRRLKASARQVLVGFGDPVVAPLAYFMQDREEDIWVRRHVPATLALLPGAESVAALLAVLDDPDGFLRFKAVTALARIRRERPDVVIDADVITKHISIEAARAFGRLTLHYNLFAAGGLDPKCLLARTLEEKHRRALNRTFQLLSLVFPPKDIAAVRHSLLEGEARTRSSAVEYLDNILKGDTRKRVMILVEDMPLEERVRKGNVIYRTRSRDVEDTVAQLLHDDDQSIASAAIHLIEERGLWSLADDLEHVLAHRDVRDLHVFEAASWALAANRMKPEQRKALWQEALPAIELANRLRQIPMFDFTSVDEFFRIAALGRQVRYETGRTLYERGTSPASLQFLLDGKVLSIGARAAEVDAPAALAFEEVLEGATMRAEISSVSPVITLSLTTEEFLALLAENVALAEGIFRMLIHKHGAAHTPTVVHGELPSEFSAKATHLLPIERVLLLQSMPLLAHATAAQLWHLSTMFRPMAFKAGETVCERGSESSMLIVLSGSLRFEPAVGEPQTADPGDLLGMYETLSGAPLDAAVTALGDGTGLRCVRADIFDLLADNTDLLQGIFSGLLHA